VGSASVFGLPAPDPLVSGTDPDSAPDPYNKIDPHTTRYGFINLLLGTGTNKIDMTKLTCRRWAGCT